MENNILPGKVQIHQKRFVLFVLKVAIVAFIGCFSLDCYVPPSAEGQETGLGDGLKFTWDNVESKLDELGENGFEGSVLLTRDGKVFLEKAYGFANRTKKIKNNRNTVFAIGSAPIDFTHASVLLLKDQGKLRLDDAITTFFKHVPQDKKAITIRHLMTGQSGLRDFHDKPSDQNADHTWIDREEAVRRILAQRLLFKPGSGKEHSHSAWGLLAAIIEITTGETYPDFTRKQLFMPIGMKDTGFFGEPVSENRLAIGYGYKKSSEPNAPSNWGPTSWLVMGSGGQISTLRDLLKWEQAMHEGSILSKESKNLYLGNGGGVSSDGDMFGFEFMHSRNPQSLFMIISNAVDSRAKRKYFDSIGRGLFELTSSQPRARNSKFSFGAAMAISSAEGVVLQSVVGGSAAEIGGLKSGDKLIEVNGVMLDERPMDVLGPAIDLGKPFELKFERDGKTKVVTITPQKRQGN